MPDSASLRLEFGNCMGERVPGGIAADRLEGDLQERFAVAHASVEARRAAGDLGFLDLPYASDTVGQVKDLAEGFGQWFRISSADKA